MIIASGIIGGYSAHAVTFDGTNDYLVRSGGPDGLADGKLGLLSFWFKGGAISAPSSLMQAGRYGRVSMVFSNVNGHLYIFGRRSTGALAVSMNSTISVLDDSWHHCLAAWDVSSNDNCKLYIDDVDRTDLATRSDNNIDYATGDMQIGAANGSDKIDMDLAEFYFTTEWIDITASANRQKFAKSGRPVSLGSDGSKPTGTAPLVYLRGPASNWGTNSGTGGDFSVVGAFTDAATKPSY